MADIILRVRFNLSDRVTFIQGEHRSINVLFSDQAEELPLDLTGATVVFSFPRDGGGSVKRRTGALTLGPPAAAQGDGVTVFKFASHGLVTGDPVLLTPLSGPAPSNPAASTPSAPVDPTPSAPSAGTDSTPSAPTEPTEQPEPTQTESTPTEEPAPTPSESTPSTPPEEPTVSIEVTDLPALPAPLSATATYYVNELTPDTFSLADAAGAAVLLDALPTAPFTMKSTDCDITDPVRGKVTLQLPPEVTSSVPPGQGQSFQVALRDGSGLVRIFSATNQLDVFAQPCP